MCVVLSFILLETRIIHVSYYAHGGDWVNKHINAAIHQFCLKIGTKCTVFIPSAKRFVFYNKLFTIMKTNEIIFFLYIGNSYIFMHILTNLATFLIGIQFE